MPGRAATDPCCARLRGRCGFSGGGSPSSGATADARVTLPTHAAQQPLPLYDHVRCALRSLGQIGMRTLIYPPERALGASAGLLQFSPWLARCAHREPRNVALGSARAALPPTG